ncbi:mono/diheme cytochrome c family protein [Luteibacter rhizovicinus]|uniref:Mono/diheme cytochrome c family protein n=1 Tax=Luteibacter rhizovicinus TaxID=242606 RepID=A0A4R3YMK9_9GAMM|nr:cytochrome c [Luteibacter rhizovicinus]TCV94045.1 mono/diheme cytochrome c family protein [Luteibacter rhizovicinus]
MMRMPIFAVTLAIAGMAHAGHDDAFIDRKDAATVDGRTIFTHLCQACHMADGKGATGAGAYPALAGNPKLLAPLYPAAMVMNGRGAMPGFGQMFSDEQIASVVNYVRTHLGNHYPDTLSAADVKALRPPEKP